MYKYTFYFLILVFACHSPNKLNFKVTKFIPVANQRASLICTSNKIDNDIEKYRNMLIKKLDLDTAYIYYWSFYSQHNKWNENKKEETEENTTNFKIKKIKNKNGAGPKLYKDEIVLKQASSDSNINADVKLLIGINRLKKEILLIVDKNNNDNFLDDSAIKIDKENFKKIFDTLTINVTNLKEYANGEIKNYSIPIMINSISNFHGSIDSIINSIVDPEISASRYYTGFKRIDKKKIYFILADYLYNLNATNSFVIINNQPVKRNVLPKKGTFYDGRYFMLENVGYKLDTIKCRKQKCRVILIKGG